jgi:hypothetical protein
MRSSLLFCLAMFFFTGNVSAQTFLWAQQAGGIWPDEGHGICSDAQGNTIVTGEFGGEMRIGSAMLKSKGGSDVFVAKYSATGRLLWAVAGGGEGWDAGTSVTADNEGNIYLTGYFEGEASFENKQLSTKGETDVFIAKYSPSGVLLWVEQAGGSDINIGKSIKTDNKGNVYVTGSFSGQAAFGSTILQSEGHGDVFLLNLDTDGKVQWVRKAGGWKNDEGRALAIGSDDHVYLTGIYSEQSHFENLTLHGSRQDIFIAKYTPEGTLVWAKTSDAPNEQATHFSNGIDVDAHGNSYITGYFQNTMTLGNNVLNSAGAFDIFLAKYNEAGQLQWATSAGGSLDDSMGDEVATGICLDAEGNPYISGKFFEKAAFGDVTLTSDAGSDIFVAKYSASGDVMWAQQAGGDGHGNGAHALCSDKRGNIYVTGSFYGDATFDETHLTNAEGYSSADLFVARLTGKQAKVVTSLNNPEQSTGIQAYPNPFAQQVALEFVPQQSDKVTFEIIDMKGMVVARLYDGNVTAGLPVNLNFEASGLPNGIYIGKLTSGNFTETTRLVLSR